jgi:poly(A) polymerase
MGRTTHLGRDGSDTRQPVSATELVRRPDLDPLVVALGGGETTRLIGGVVRDTLLGLSVSDVDMATRLTPDEVVARLKTAHIKSVPTGIAHGTITAVTDHGRIEITTLRRDVSTDGRRATVAFTDDWREDAARRDFTINALSVNPETGEIYDYFGGRDDLATGHVRFIGEPLQRIAEDHLRILRFFRFYARFGKGEPDAAAYDACAARANDLMALSRERIASELLKLLSYPAPVAAVRLMLARDILTPVLPEITTTDTLDVLVTRERTHSNPIRRLAALIGPDPAVAKEIAARLKLSKAQSKRLITACGWSAPSTSIPALAYRLGKESARDRLLLGGNDPTPLDTWKRPTFPITGGTLVARGLEPGPVVAQTLMKIETAWIDADFPTGAAFDTILDRLSPKTRTQI